MSKSKVLKTDGLGPFWKLRCPKSARRCGTKHISKSLKKMFGPRLDVQMSFRVAGARDCAPCQKWVKTGGFCSISKNDGRRGTFEEDLERCMSRGRRSTRDMFMRDVRRSGRWFLEGLHFGASDLQFWEDDFAGQVQHFVWPGITFSWQAQYFRQVEWKNRKRHWYEAVSSALNFPCLKRKSRRMFRFWRCQLRKLRKSRRIVSFLMLSSSKIEGVSQNCFVFDVVKFKNWGSLAELFRFWGYQLRKLRKSRRIVSFLMLSSSKIEGVSQNCFVFDVVKFKNWGSLAELFRFWGYQVQMRKSRRIASFLTLSSSKTEEVSQNSFVFKLADRQIDSCSYNYNYITPHYTNRITLITLHYTQLHYTRLTPTTATTTLHHTTLH